MPSFKPQACFCKRSPAARISCHSSPAPRLPAGSLPSVKGKSTRLNKSSALVIFFDTGAGDIEHVDVA